MHSCSPFLKLSLTLATLFFHASTFAQPGTISGKITDESNDPLTGAIAELRNASDSSLAKVNVADAKGIYSFVNVKAGSYFLKTSLLGFAPQSGKEFSYDGVQEKEMPTIKMGASTTTLKQAEVAAIKPLIEVRSDKTVFNVESSINSTGSTAYELLQKAPGVVVDNNDNVSLKGRGGVLVQIDGKDMRLSTEELGDYLKSIQSSDVESIELISNPSSKYDAAGTAGIINIRLKKNKNYGTNGSIALAYATGKYSKYNTTLSLNNRSKKFNIYGSYGNNWGKRQNEFYLYREQYPNSYDQGSINKRWGLGHTYKAGIDYTMNAKNSFGIMANGNLNDMKGTNTSRNVIHNLNTDATESILHSNQTVAMDANNFNLNLNHHFADTFGHDLTTDFDYGYYDSNRNNYQPNIYTLPDDVTVLSSAYYRSLTPTTITIYTLKSDYSQNFLKGKLGAGFKVSLVNTDNTFDFYNITNGTETIDNSRSNHFVYTENVTAVYLNYQRTLKKFDVQAGVRMENTQSEGDLKSATANTADKNVTRTYTDYFPSAGITYNANKNNSLALVYSSRIDRPNYQELNPFEFKLDELNFRKGNPFLDPQYSNTFELSHTYKYTITTSASYSHTRDFFAQITDTIPGGKSYITSLNLATEEVVGANVSASLQPLKWYSLYMNVGVYNQEYTADFGQGKTIHTAVAAFNLYAQNTIKLPANFSLEVSGWYNSGGVWGGAYVNSGQGQLDLGLQKKLFRDQATLKLAYTDVLHTAPWSSYNTYAGIVIRAHGNWESQLFRASFTWRFGNKQMKAARQRTTGSESEQKRIGGGGE
jgi:iron complex outermembrane recepter protein